MRSSTAVASLVSIARSGPFANTLAHFEQGRFVAGMELAFSARSTGIWETNSAGTSVTGTRPNLADDVGFHIHRCAVTAQ
jgi:hypothetical protein